MNTKLLSLLSSYDTHLSNYGNFLDLCRTVGHYLISTTTMVPTNPIDTLDAMELILERIKLIFGHSEHRFNVWTGTRVELVLSGRRVRHDANRVDLATLRDAAQATIFFDMPYMAPWEVHELLGLPPLTSKKVEGLLRESDVIVEGWVQDHYRLLHAALLTKSTPDTRRLRAYTDQSFVRWWEARASTVTLEAWAAVVDEGIMGMLSDVPSNPWRPSRP
jgi:hypothetical protein